MGETRAKMARGSARSRRSWDCPARHFNMLVTADRPRNPANCPVHTPKPHAVPPCTCNNGVTLCSRRASQRAADSASMPAPSGVSPLPASGCQKPQPHSSRHAKYNPVDSAAMSSDSQCGRARRQPCGESLTVRRTTPGAGRCSSGRPPLPTVSESRKQASRGYKPSRSAICRRAGSRRCLLWDSRYATFLPNW